MRDVFILGAGFSRAVSDRMPLLAELSDMVHERVGEMSLDGTATMFGGDIEMWLTYLSEDNPWLTQPKILRNRALLLDLQTAVTDVLEDRQKLAEDSSPAPEWLSTLLKHWHYNRTAVISLNYDTLIERIAADTPVKDDPGDANGRAHPLDCASIYPVPLTPGPQRVAATLSGGVRASLRLHKLHGSVNWYYSGDERFSGQPIYYLDTIGGWGRRDGVYESDWRKYVEDLVPLIVPPLLSKTPYFRHASIRALWSGAAMSLRNATQVFCIGYSFPQTDITMQLFMSTNAPPATEGRRAPLFVVDTDSGVVTHYQRLLSDRYEVRGDYAGEQAVKHLVEALTQGDLLNSADTGTS